MFSHVMVGSGDLERSKSFYNRVLGTLGFEGEPIHSIAPSGHSRLFYRHNGGTFCVTEPINGEPVAAANGGTVGFQCESPEQVQQFHDVAVANGGTSCEDPPGLRDGALGPIHLAYVRDPDGNKLCALHRPKA
jgi:catechol 2,3-dioxygenase-like lactoylglutathione lyase family enzyme